MYDSQQSAVSRPRPRPRPRAGGLAPHVLGEGGEDLERAHAEPQPHVAADEGEDGVEVVAHQLVPGHLHPASRSAHFPH